MSDKDRTETFEITHDSKILDFQGEPLCCIIDSDPLSKQICNDFVNNGFDYNLKGIILRTPDGHKMACRYVVKNESHFLDYKIAPSNEWITLLRKSKKLAICDTSNVVMMIGTDIWTGDIENVLSGFYSHPSD